MSRAHHLQSRQLRRRRGFGTILCMFALMLVASALIAGGALRTADLRRTHAIQQAAQLRQLLVAGAMDVSQRALKWKRDVEPQTWSIALPAEMTDDRATLSVQVEKRADQTAAAKIRAVVGADHAEQELLFRRVGERWVLASIDARL